MQSCVVLLSGWAGSGKDAAAAIMVEEMGFRRFAFADALKQDVAEKTGIPLTTFHTAAKDQSLEILCKTYPTALTPRDLLLQHAKIKRDLDPDTYSGKVIEEIRTIGVQKAVISDWRYRREHAHIYRELYETMPILTVRITRPGIQPSSDPSEHDLNNMTFDIEIINDGTLVDLRHHLRSLIP
jgi:hypothetical protein